MKIFITIGTTPFDQLIRYCDHSIAMNSKYEIEAQIASGSYEPVHMQYFRFTDHIEKYYDKCDVIICHAGAGTVYRLLELGKKIIIVPNLDRRENHQLEIGRYAQENNYALVATSYDRIASLLSNINEFRFTLYKNESSGIINSISQIITR